MQYGRMRQHWIGFLATSEMLGTKQAVRLKCHMVKPAVESQDLLIVQWVHPGGKGKKTHIGKKNGFLDRGISIYLSIYIDHLHLYLGLYLLSIYLSIVIYYL